MRRRPGDRGSWRSITSDGVDEQCIRRGPCFGDRRQDTSRSTSATVRRHRHKRQRDFVTPLSFSNLVELIMDAELIQSDPAVMMGKPVVAGTRITVELILEKLSAGETVD